ncbi:hypothetical protein [Neobacillus jeddahensis]|uniref:hypothetical protein n=1 Tax=Neobacillus jeddahensis TaxID=1461580 RepID=UPI00058BBC56|nr:hypothetical protein [Neobacillus jeddahensis]
MNSKCEDSFLDFKKIEAEMNKKIHEYTNTRGFTLAFGKALEVHLKQVKLHRRLTKRWLNHLELVNKDEIAALSNRMVDLVEKIDLLDETIYHILQMQKRNKAQLKMVRESNEEWFTFLKSEVRETRNNKITTLEKELLELRLLFIDEVDKEDIDYDGEK